MGAYPNVLFQNLLDDLHEAGVPPYLLGMDNLPPDASHREASAWSLTRSLLKKYEKKNSEKQDQAALEKFRIINSRCAEWEPRYSDSWDEVLVGELRAHLWSFFHESGSPLFSSLEEFAHYGRTGPGSSIGARSNNFYSKMFASPLTCTRVGLYHAYKNYIRNFPEWANAEIIRHAHYGEAHVVAGNRLSFVPKDDKISRSICTEPSLNMFFQLGAGHVLERRLLKCYGISMAEQQFKNRELARRGSLGLGFVTCDLASASDSLAIKMLEFVMPKHVVDMLKYLRSPTSKCPDGQVLNLEMISTMGNGFTFPLQTILFSSVVVAAMRARDVKIQFPRGREHGNFGVFGDDIICPDEVWPDVYRLLRFLGFRVNDDKTFVNGPFRESCGSDFFRGRNIRGVYVKRLTSPQDLFAVINQLNQFSTRTGIYLKRCVQYLAQKAGYCFVPRWDNFDSGIQVPFSMIPKQSLRFHKELQSVLYWRYEPIGARIRISENAVIVPRGAKPLIYNPSGLFMSFLQQSINSYSIGVRHDIVRYKRKQGVAPFWDATPSVHPLTGWFDWQRWETAVYFNLFG